MKKYTIVAGVNGVGKSSLIGVLSSSSSDIGIVIDTDSIKEETASAEKIDDCLKKGISFTQETTLSGVRTIKTIKRAIELDYEILLYYVGIGSVDESIERIKNRVKKGGHDIPNEDVKRRYEKRFEDLIKILPYCNEATLFDNENGFIEVAEYKNGKIIKKTDSSIVWLDELIEKYKSTK